MAHGGLGRCAVSNANLVSLRQRHALGAARAAETLFRVTRSARRRQEI